MQQAQLGVGCSMLCNVMVPGNVSCNSSWSQLHPGTYGSAMHAGMQHHTLARNSNYMQAK